MKANSSGSVMRDAGGHVLEIDLWVEVVGFCRVEQRVQGGSTLSPASEPAERKIFRPRVSSAKMMAHPYDLVIVSGVCSGGGKTR